MSDSTSETSNPKLLATMRNAIAVLGRGTISNDDYYNDSNRIIQYNDVVSGFAKIPNNPNTKNYSRRQCYCYLDLFDFTSEEEESAQMTITFLFENFLVSNQRYSIVACPSNKSISYDAIVANTFDEIYAQICSYTNDLIISDIKLLSDIELIYYDGVEFSKDTPVKLYFLTREGLFFQYKDLVTFNKSQTLNFNKDTLQ